MTTIAEAPPSRKGQCSLTLSINGRIYKLRSAPPLSRNSRTWRLTVAAGQRSAGITYSVATFHGRVDCTCPDATRNFAACKHQQALRALGLIPKSARPSGQFTWDLMHPKPARKQRVAAPAAPTLPTAASGPDPLARARRRHQPTIGQDSPAAASVSSPTTEATTWFQKMDARAAATAATAPDQTAASFAAGFRSAVAEHAARLAAGGVS